MEVKVYLGKSEKPVFDRIVTTCDGLDIDCILLLRSMRILFGNGCRVEFKFFAL